MHHEVRHFLQLTDWWDHHFHLETKLEMPWWQEMVWYTHLMEAPHEKVNSMVCLQRVDF